MKPTMTTADIAQLAGVTRRTLEDRKS